MSISDSLKEEFIDVKTCCDAYNEAIKLATAHGISNNDLRKIIVDKSAFNTMHLKLIETVLSKMDNSINTLDLGYGWWAIRYINEKKQHWLKVEMLHENDLHLVQRETLGNARRELSRMDLESLLPAIIDYERLDEYKKRIEAKAIAFVKQYCDFIISSDVESVDVIRPISISFHAGTRWVQRVYKINPTNEKMAEEYRRQHQKQVEEDILNGFKSAEHVWTNDEGVQYFFDSDNIMYVKGTDSTIITLYEEDFGFSKNINRNIVYEQIKVLEQLRSDLVIKEEECYTETNVLEAELYLFTEELRLKEAEISLIKSKQILATSKRDSVSKTIHSERIAYSIECNKLFKKFEG